MKPIQKISLILYVALLLAPGVLRSAHIFADHQHEFCDHSADEHLHQENTECDLFNFQQHIFPGLELLNFEIVLPEIHHSTSSYAGSFIIDQHCLNITLRGPPSFSDVVV